MEKLSSKEEVGTSAISAPPGGAKKRVFWNKKRRMYLFVGIVLIFPILHFLVTYVYVNINSVLLAFQEYNDKTGHYKFIGGKNFAELWSAVRIDPLLSASFRNSTVLYLVGLLVGTPLNILIAYAIYKKIPASGIYRVIMFLPSIISGMVFVMIYKYFAEYGIPVIAEAFQRPLTGGSLLVNQDTAFAMLIIYGLWTGFGVGIILYSNAMSRVPYDLIEFGKLEGINSMQELWHIILPLVFPTFTTFLVTGVAGYFTNQGATYAFFGNRTNPNITTLGYYFFIRVVGGGSGGTNPVEYPFASAAGLVFTLVAAPITLLVKWALEKFGPSAEY